MIITELLSGHLASRGWNPDNLSHHFLRFLFTEPLLEVLMPNLCCVTVLLSQPSQFCPILSILVYGSIAWLDLYSMAVRSLGDHL